MTAELITIGDEILIGQIVNTNAVFLSKSLNRIGFEVVQITSISDQPKMIKKTIDEARQRADVLLLTGGLGPTNDDVTKHTLTDYFDDRLVWYPEILSHIETLFKKYVPTPISDSNRAQAQLPEKARIFKNTIGTASGLWFEAKDVVVVSMPGVPYEMKSMITDSIIPFIQTEFNCPVIIKKTLMTYGVGESTIAKKLKDFEKNLPDNFKLAYLPNLGRVRLRLSCKGFDRDNLNSNMDLYIEQLHKLLGKIIIGFEFENTIESEIGKILKKLGKTVSTAESFTGGLISSRISSVPGASLYYKGSIVAYDTHIKKSILSVDDELIKKYSVVSKEVADSMAKNVKKIFNSDYSITTTGNAGPEKGDSDKKIGTINISIASPAEIKTYEFNFGKNREKNIKKSVNKALELFFSELLTQV